MRCVACWRVVLLHIFFSAIVIWIIGHDYRARWFVSSKRICDKKAIQREKKTKEISKALEEVSLHDVEVGFPRDVDSAPKPISKAERLRAPHTQVTGTLNG